MQRIICLIFLSALCTINLGSIAHADMGGRYSYTHEGHKGSLVLEKRNSQTYEVNVETMKSSTGHSCFFEGVCKENNGQLHCIDPSLKNSSLIITKEKTLGQVHITKAEPFAYMCGNEGRVVGIYAKNPQ